MGQRILQILTTGYRATLEEQDDPVLWLTHSLRNNGAAIDMLFRSTAVNYVVRGQSVRGLTVGQWQQTQPPDIAFEVHALISKECRAYVVVDDLVARAELPALLRNYKHVWQW